MNMFLSLSLSLILLAEAQTTPLPSTSQPAVVASRRPPIDPAKITSLIAALSSPDSHARESATLTLMEAGPECYGPLREAFSTTRLYDVRRRIRVIALEIYLTERLGPPKAFLGISHRGLPVMENNEARVPPWATALFVTDVFKASSAQRAGLQSGDLVVALNGKPATLEKPAIEFTQWIGEQAPGTQCEVMVLRGGTGHKLVSDARMEFRPSVLGAAQVEAVTHAQDGRVPPGVGGVLLRSVRGVPVELDVQDGDLILSLDEEPLPESGADAHFRQWVEGKWKGKGFRRATRPPQAVGRFQPGEEVVLQTAHVLRGGEGVDLTVALGRWPTYLSDQVQGAPRASSVGQREYIIESFGSWWTERFDPEGTFSERADLDREWRLEPGLQRH